MADFLLACLNCVQALSEPVSQNPPCAIAESERHSPSRELPGAESACVSEPEVFQTLFASSIGSPQRQAELASDGLASASRSTAPERLPASEWSPGRSTASAGAPPILLKLGSQNKTVAQLQGQLRQLGYPVGPMDGLYGAQTRAAVMAFQRENGLAIDGIVGPQTWTVLEKLIPATASPNPDPATTASPNTTSPSTASPDTQAESIAPSLASPPVSLPETSRQVPERNEQTASPSQEIGRSLPIVFPREAYLWIAGWGILYAAGWVVILRMAVKEQQMDRAAHPSQKPSPQGQQPANGEPLTLSVQAEVIEEKPEAAPEEPLPVQDPTSAPATRAEISANDGLEGASADEEALMLASLPVDPGTAPTPATAPIASQPATEEIAARSEVQPAPPEAKETLQEEEVVMLTFPLEAKGERYTYSLVDDAGGVFVMRGGELRLKPQRLEQDTLKDRITKTATLRRVDSQGRSSEQSFEFQLQKTPQPIYAS